MAAVDTEDVLVGLRSVRERARDLYVTDADLEVAKREGRP